MLNLEEIRNTIKYLSGSGKRVVSTRRNGIYSSFTLEGLDDILAVRDTSQRFADFGIPVDLTGKTFLDIGSNVGAMSFEAARRGAIVTGLEYRDDRVALCQTIAKRYDFDSLFYQVDLNNGEPTGPWRTEGVLYDYVLCCSVDEYISDIEWFYDLLYGLSYNVIYLESNRQKISDLEDVTIGILQRHGFKNAEYLGNGHSGGIGRKRKLFRAKV